MKGLAKLRIDIEILRKRLEVLEEELRGEDIKKVVKRTEKHCKRLKPFKTFYIIHSERFIYGIASTIGEAELQKVEFKIPFDITGVRSTSYKKALRIATKDYNLRLDARMIEIYNSL